MPDLCVAQVISNLKLGGAQKLLCVLTENQAHAEIDIKVAVLDGPSDTRYHDELTSAGVPIAYIPKDGGTSLGQIRRLAAWFRREGIVLSHSHLERGNIISPLAARICRIPAVCGLHITDSEGGGFRTWRRAVETTVMNRAASGIVACSPLVATSHERRVPSRDILVVTNPVPYSTMPDGPNDRSGKGEGETRFLVVGRLAPEKGIDMVLEAASRLVRHTSSFTISIAGSGSHRELLESQCRLLKLEKHVRFLGPVSDPSLLYRSHDVYLSASRIEGLSLALLEAMAHKMPVIVTDAGDAGHLVTAETGYLIPRNDVASVVRAMLALIQAPRLRRTLGENGCKRVVEDHSPRAWAESLGEIYRGLLQSCQ